MMNLEKQLAGIKNNYRACRLEIMGYEEKLKKLRETALKLEGQIDILMQLIEQQEPMEGGAN